MIKSGMIVALVATAPLMVVGFALSPSMMSGRTRVPSSLAGSTTTRMAADAPKRVLVIGGTRFTGLYLTRELHARGHEVRTRSAHGALLQTEFRWYSGSDDL